MRPGCSSWQHHINISQANKQTHYNNPILPHPAQNRQSRHGSKGQKKGTQNTSTKQRHNVTKTHLPIKFTSCLQHFQTDARANQIKKIQTQTDHSTVQLHPRYHIHINFFSTFFGPARKTLLIIPAAVRGKIVEEKKYSPTIFTFYKHW